jgi:cytochrome P450
MSSRGSLGESASVVDGFDPFSIEFLRDPYPILERARREAPVFFYEPLNSWIVTRYDDVAEILRDFTTYSSRAIVTPPPPEELRGKVPENLMANAFVVLDPPGHTVARKMGNTWFTRPKIAALENGIRATANDLIDRFIDRGHCDFMHDYAYALTLLTITDLLGLDRENIPKFAQWTEDMFVLMQPGDMNDESTHALDDDRTERWRRMGEAWDYYKDLVAQRRTSPRDDLATVMVQATKEDGSPALSNDQIVTHIMELIAAGNDTTANLMAHMLMFFTQTPELIDEVRADPALMANAVEEGLRRRGSSPMMFRRVTRDVELGGHHIPEGSLVAPCFISAGHDESYFPDPRCFDPHRENARQHLSFVKGRHMCMGAPLARAMSGIGLQTFLERIPNVHVDPDQELDYAPTLTAVALHHLAIDWETTPQ